MNRLPYRLATWGIAALLLFVSACDLSELNEDPNQPTTVTPATLLPRGLNLIAANDLDSFNAGRFSLIYAQYWTQNQYTSEDRYTFPTDRATSMNAMWNQYYVAMNNLQEIVRLYEADAQRYSAYGNPANMEAIVLILQAYSFQNLTDIWGPIPFTEALGGQDAPAPSYNSQEEVYRGILDMLTRANGLINVNAPGPSAGDLVYGGNMAQWKKLANSLKLRAAIRIADRLPQVASTAITEALAAGVFTSANDGAQISFSAAPPYQNPIFVNYEGGRDDWAVTNTLVDYMQPANDPRLPIYADPSDLNGQIVPFAYGQTQGAAQAVYSTGNFSRPGVRVRQAATPSIIMLYDEVLFIQAEAVERGFIQGNAQSLYQDAIRASMAFWGVTDQAAINSFIASVPYNSANWRQSIGRQKWVALYMQGIQGWSEWRRLDFGLLQRPAGGPAVDFGRDIAIRLPYPLVEQTLNAVNFQAAVATLGGPDNQGTPVWWDVTQ